MVMFSETIHTNTLATIRIVALGGQASSARSLPPPLPACLSSRQAAGPAQAQAPTSTGTQARVALRQCTLARGSEFSTVSAGCY